MMIQMEDKNNKEEKGINQSRYKHLYLKIFIAFLLAMASATGCLFIAFAYQGLSDDFVLVSIPSSHVRNSMHYILLCCFKS